MNLGPRFYWNLPITNLYWVFIFQGYLILHHLNMTLGQLKSEWSVSRCHPHSSQQVRTFERSASSQDHPGAVCLSCHCSPLPTRRKRNVFIYFCLNIHPLSTSYEFFWFKKKKKTHSDGATSDPLLPATSVIPQPWGLFSWILPARGIYSLCHFMPNRVLQHTKSHRNQLWGHYYLKVALLEVTCHLLQSPSHRKTSLYHLGPSFLFGEMRH